MSHLIQERGSEADVHMLCAAIASYDSYQDFGPELVEEFIEHPVWLALRQRIATTISSSYERIDRMDSETPDRAIHVSRGMIVGLKWLLGAPAEIVADIKLERYNEGESEENYQGAAGKQNEKALRDILGY